MPVLPVLPAARGSSSPRSDVWVVSLGFTAQRAVRFNLLFADYGEAEHALLWLRHTLNRREGPRGVRFLTMHWRG